MSNQARSSGNLWLFGGQGYGSSAAVNGDLNDLWEFSPSTKQWTWVSGGNDVNAAGVYGTQGTPATSNIPGGRDSAVGWVDASGNFWLFGGEEVGYFNDLWRYQP